MLPMEPSPNIAKRFNEVVRNGHGGDPQKAVTALPRLHRENTGPVRATEATLPEAPGTREYSERHKSFMEKVRAIKPVTGELSAVEMVRKVRNDRLSRMFPGNRSGDGETAPWPTR
uniref:Uncharacterized protein n=1 Tax=Candidatus Kentrum sp. DK TaxID=2126562 RepID=A0A450RTZ5_9GAMM|nr:MAG: hypothetical protein BECKDK2373C_GA0170839_1001109 [Candidatus Kentron sp. DK]